MSTHPLYTSARHRQDARTVASILDLLPRSARKICLSDNNQAADPRVVEFLGKINEAVCRTGLPAYGEDLISAIAEAILKQHFGEEVVVHFLPTGTAANVLALAALARCTDTILCSQESHLIIDECHAPIRFLGAALKPIASHNGKITAEALEAAIADNQGVGWYHKSSPRVVSLTQPTEVGTTYSLSELHAICAAAHAHGMSVHMDGARLTYAAVALGANLWETSFGAGVDVLTLGLTKCGALSGNVLLFASGRCPADFKRMQKQAMCLIDKTWHIAAQCVVLFEKDLWRRNAESANEAARALASGLRARGVPLAYPVETNAVFAHLSADAAARLAERFSFYVWDAASGLARFMTTSSVGADDLKTFFQTYDDKLLR